MSDLFDYPNTPGFKERTTSLEAAAAVSCRSGILRDRVYSLLRRSRPLTADEIAHSLRESVLSVRPRVSELHSAGKIQCTGKRRANRSGLSAHVWRVVEDAHA
jgi:predicted ArsR family transcriptional regulator